jgi:hypothetical protein
MDPHERRPYQQLEPSKRHFRLLRLLECGSDDIQFELNIFSLLDDDLPPWKALSYRWGEDEPDSLSASMTRLYLLVTTCTLSSPRWWLRNDDSGTILTPYALTGVTKFEKPGQVREMGGIYRRAEEVVAWIVYEPYHHEEDSDKATYDLTNSSDDISSMSRAELERAAIENSYWSRLWILQEVLLAKGRSSGSEAPR